MIPSNPVETTTFQLVYFPFLIAAFIGFMVSSIAYCKDT